MKLVSILGISASIALLAQNSFAQAVAASAEADATSNGESDAAVETEVAENDPPPATVSEPQPEPRTTAAEDNAVAGKTDHEQMVGRFAVGYMGRETILLGVPQSTEGFEIVAPIIGARYWLSSLLGLDLGIGFNASGGMNTDPMNPDESVSKVGVTAFLLHAGVPLSLANSQHFSFQVVPEANFGFAVTGDQDPSDDNSLKDSGIHLSAGARAGAEVHFGFMGLPQLSLQGSIGLYFQMDATTNTTNVGGTRTKISDTSLTFGTSVGSDPWDIFTSNISALYYF